MKKIIKINDFSDSRCMSGGSYTMTTSDKLVKLFGEPTKSDSYKSDWIWRLTLDDHSLIDLYDWKLGKNYLGEEDGLSFDEIRMWSISSDKKENSEFLQTLIDFFLNKEDWGRFEYIKEEMFFNLEE